MKLKIFFILSILFLVNFAFSQTNGYERNNAKLLKKLENTEGAEKIQTSKISNQD